MQVREDLTAVAEQLAKAARVEATPRRPAAEGVQEVPGEYGKATHYAMGVKAALEAAALVDVDPAPIVAALERFGGRLAEMHVQEWLVPDDPAAALSDVAGFVEAWKAEVDLARAVQHGYVRLSDAMTSLFNDFSAADSETARRTAARIRTALEEAEQAITDAKGEGD